MSANTVLAATTFGKCNFFLVFLTADGYDVVEGSRLVVTRVVKKDRSSKYLLDDKVSSFTEVGKVLRKRGIDLDNNRFLILQVS